MSRFPKLTETFILFEMLALEERAADIFIYPLLRARKSKTDVEGASLRVKIIELLSPSRGELVMHPEAQPLVDRANFLPFVSWKIVCTQFYYLLSKPRRYLSTLATLIKANWGSANYLVGGLSIFMKVAYAGRLMKRDGIDHIHAHFANHPAAAAFVIHRLTDIPYSFTAHGADLQVDQHMLTEKIRESSFAVTISEYNKEFILDSCGQDIRDKVMVLYCGVDTELFSPSSESKGKNAPFTIICTGTMYEVKGHTYLIEACRILQQRGIDFVCQLVGEGEFQPALEAQVHACGLTDRVQFLGRKTRQELANLLQHADMAATPSIPTESGRREGIPVVIMEAMSSGIPVVASEISGIPELISHGENGLLVSPRDPCAIADAVELLATNRALREALGEVARKTVLSKFDQRENAAVLLARMDSKEAQ